MSNHYKYDDPALDYKREKELNKKRENIHKVLKYRSLNMHDYVDGLSDADVYGLESYLMQLLNIKPGFKFHDANIEKIKVFLRLFSIDNDNDYISRILSFLESPRYGWQENKYNLDNHCLSENLHSPKGCCKRTYNISQVDDVVYTLYVIFRLFFERSNTVAKYIHYIFCYCITAAFVSKLYKDKFYIPFYLQIACDRSSALYRIIQTIVTICDVNTGIFECCPDHSRYGNICGDRSHKAYYPTQSSSKDFENLSCHNDIPVVIFGYENERYYNALLREIANSSYKPKQLARRDRLTVLPVFICPVIKSSFENVIDIDLSDIEVTQEYHELIEDNKQFLSSVVLKLVDEIDVNSHKLTKDFFQRELSLPNIIGERIEQT